MDHERFEIANLDLHKTQTGRKTEESRAMAVPLCFKRDCLRRGRHPIFSVFLADMLRLP
jgi:hypothetical protein